MFKIHFLPRVKLGGSRDRLRQTWRAGGASKGLRGLIKFAFSNPIPSARHPDTIKTSCSVYYVFHYYCYYIVVSVGVPTDITARDSLWPFAGLRRPAVRAPTHPRKNNSIVRAPSSGTVSFCFPPPPHPFLVSTFSVIPAPKLLSLEAGPPPPLMSSTPRGSRHYKTTIYRPKNTLEVRAAAYRFPAYVGIYFQPVCCRVRNSRLIMK